MRFYCTICGYHAAFMLRPVRCRGCMGTGSMKEVPRGIPKHRKSTRYGSYTIRGGKAFRQRDAKESQRSVLARRKLETFKTPLPNHLLPFKKRKHSPSMTSSPQEPPPSLRREEVHEEEAGLDLGVGTFNINHFSQKTAKAKKDLLLRLFEQNPWLDVLVLQEINKKALPLLKSIDFKGHGLTLVLGPQMQAVYPKYKGQKASEDDDSEDEDSDDESSMSDTDEETWTLGKSQCEWYPIIFRTSCCTDSSWRAFSGGEVKRRSSDRSTEPIQWAKPVEYTKAPKGWTTKYPTLLKERREQYRLLNARHLPWRPVVVHDLRIGKHDVHIGVVHTSPAGQGLGRMGEYEQVSGFFQHVSQNTGEPWIIAGDYYIDPEATVAVNSDTKSRQWDDLFHVKADTLGLTLSVPVSASNQSSQTYRSVNSKKNQEQFKEKGYIKDWDQVGDKFKLNKRADFFVISRAFALHHTGIFSPVKGLLPVDPNHQALNFWAQTSDHAPTGGIFCDSPFSEKWARNWQLISESLGTRQSQAQLEVWELQKQAVDELLSSLRELIPLLTRLQEDGLRLAQRLCVLIVKALNSPAAIAIRGVSFEPDEQYPRWKANSQNVTQQHLSEFFGVCAQVETASVLNSPHALEQFALLFRNAYRALQQIGIRPRSFDLTPESETYSQVKLGTRQTASTGSRTGKEKLTQELQQEIIELLSGYLEKQRSTGSPPPSLVGCVQGSVNQFQVPGGRTACSAMAVLGIAAVLAHGGELDTERIDNILLEGTALYQRMNTATEDETELMQALALSCGGMVDPIVLQPQAPYYNPLEIPEEEIRLRGLLQAGAGTSHRDTLGQELASLLRQGERMGVALVLGGYTVSVIRNGDAYYLFDSHGWKDRRNAFVQRYAFVNELLVAVGKMAKSRALFDHEIGVTLYLPEDV
ncbi:hypothetical protein [Corallococcus sp. Z5C101001]|uniref:hypothetical protein n=1 Tax=Corallococcus sp. Z5C101001 TaxID=2596829 RepID=UPI00117F8876|nr:hypothetical protein [Corallococcus sp. Z5C101001]TSC24101.1 hypothetical protein FOF48_28330 [Corallococcus sp. Z5C101001]